tara:strand:+ start:277 stop:921 length:645 start_codon:yes stop_codon:yes gene_type:complete
MDEDLAIINTNTRNQRIKDFFLNNKKSLMILISITFIFLMTFFILGEYKKKKKVEISNLYNSIIIEYSEKNKEKTAINLIEIINENDPTYSVLALYFIIDNELTKDKEKINDLFESVINESSLEKEIKNLVIYKKALFNADEIKENDLLTILNPIINSESVWKSHALYLIAEYFYSKEEKQKSKEFFEKIVNLENSNLELKTEAQKRLSRDLSD